MAAAAAVGLIAPYRRTPCRIRNRAGRRDGSAAYGAASCYAGRMVHSRLLSGIAGSLVLAGCAAPAAVPTADFFVTPIAEKRVASLPSGPLHWRIETFPTPAQAHAAEGGYALAASVAGRHWLFTLGAPGGATPGGVRVAEIGPVTVPRAETYLLRVNHAGGPPGARTPVHTHPGSEAIHVLEGRVSQRMRHGMSQAAAGESLNAHAPEMAMQLTSSGTVPLEQLVMFVVDAERPFAPPASF